jgi:hypothetical protein
LFFIIPSRFLLFFIIPSTGHGILYFAGDFCFSHNEKQLEGIMKNNKNLEGIMKNNKNLDGIMKNNKNLDGRGGSRICGKGA